MSLAKVAKKFSYLAVAKRHFNSKIPLYHRTVTYGGIIHYEDWCEFIKPNMNLYAGESAFAGFSASAPELSERIEQSCMFCLILAADAGEL